MARFTSDHVGSDDLESVLEMSRRDVENSRRAGPSKAGNPNQRVDQSRHEITTRLMGLDAEIENVAREIEKMKVLHATLLSERQALERELKISQQKVSASSSSGQMQSVQVAGTVDYMTSDFDWSGELRARMLKVFGIRSFRLCQEGVCNANMDGRDIVCVMPTGGGKSLTYQLPALVNPGCTLVISPLISLITDQILHLREAGVEAVMLTGATSKEQSQEIFSRLLQSAGQKTSRLASTSSYREIKLCYVTPEKIAKSKSFTSMLSKLVVAGKLSRIVIDEAHCVSQLGHDFRPDYKKLSVLRQLFPRVPILALSATCPPKVLKDLIMTLRLRPIVAGTSANMDGTVYFSAPLYRKNLHYKIIPKAASATVAIKNMVDYILSEHENDSGIVYCLSKKDAEVVAEGILNASDGKIKTGVYHADVRDHDKENLHKRWRQGNIQVVCATIAFGLGIDKGDVRFVLHHSMSKSLDGYYQESGRAGRDGKDADCVLYYRPQDATRLSSLICGELEGQEKLYDMLRFAQDVEECRKLQFAKYFSASSSLSLSVWGTDETSATSPCGHCDNCTRPLASVERKDVTMDAWRILKVAENIEQAGGRVTLGMLGDLVRGAGGGAFVASGTHKRSKGKEKVGLDLDFIASGKVLLSKDDAESLIVRLILSGYLKESFNSTAYAINVYVQPGPSALRLTRLPPEDIEQGGGVRIDMAFSTKSRKKAAKQDSNIDFDKSTQNRQPARKRKRIQERSDAGVDSDEESVSFKNDLQIRSGGWEGLQQERSLKNQHQEDKTGDDWTFTLHETSAQPIIRSNGRLSSHRRPGTKPTSIADDVVILSSDSE